MAEQRNEIKVNFLNENWGKVTVKFYVSR